MTNEVNVSRNNLHVYDRTSLWGNITINSVRIKREGNKQIVHFTMVHTTTNGRGAKRRNMRVEFTDLPISTETELMFTLRGDEFKTLRVTVDQLAKEDESWWRG